ncbi:hypothetical protein HNO53_11040 [Billgrantia antri]|uniref:Uncharacterized protein n=1 Tax=Halomonas sulfidivorans TaxID=2733488 RepID=A0ABX7WGB3_9GAMM|nr:hypothetical protein [Halomonas sulfidivorans]QTP59195.1 hypothetical protein HNO53_11040 [Halomonas sulfidivorans]
MWQKIEVTGLFLGLGGVIAQLININFWSFFSDGYQELFYGGELLAFWVSIFIIVGMISSILFLVNLAFKRLVLWWARLSGFLGLYLGVAVIGASGV